MILFNDSLMLDSLVFSRECSFVKVGSVPCNFYIALLALCGPDRLALTLKI